MAMLRARVGTDFKQAVEEFCERTGRREGELIRAALSRLIERGADAAEDDEGQGPSTEYEKAEASINMSVTPSEKRAIAARARSEGMRPSRWLVWLARHHLTGKPHFNPAELDALRETTRQLAAVGSNLNQLAHAVNIDMDRRDQLTYELLHDVGAEVKALRQAIKQYVEVCVNRWGI